MIFSRYFEKIKGFVFSIISTKKIRLSDGKILYLKNVYIEGNRLKIGTDVYIGPHATILCGVDNIIIEDHVIIGPNVTLVESNHIFDKVGEYIKHAGLKGGGILIEEDCWIGANVTILAGVTIGRGCVIGACSLVTKSIPPYSVAYGIPAKIVKQRFSHDDIILHELLLSGKSKVNVNSRI